MKQDIKNRGLELNGLVMNYQKTGDEKYFEELWNEVKPFAFKMGNKYGRVLFLKEYASFIKDT